MFLPIFCLVTFVCGLFFYSVISALATFLVFFLWVFLGYESERKLSYVFWFCLRIQEPLFYWRSGYFTFIFKKNIRVALKKNMYTNVYILNWLFCIFCIYIYSCFSCVYFVILLFFPIRTISDANMIMTPENSRFKTISIEVRTAITKKVSPANISAKRLYILFKKFLI